MLLRPAAVWWHVHSNTLSVPGVKPVGRLLNSQVDWPPAVVLKVASTVACKGMLLIEPSTAHREIMSMPGGAGQGQTCALNTGSANSKKREESASAIRRCA